MWGCHCEKNMTEKAEIAEIEAACRKRGVSLRDFQEAAQVSSSTWARIRSGLTVPNGKTMNKIRAAYSDLKEGK
jgi:lambda repressor-like predicted transcriptional regulator